MRIGIDEVKLQPARGPVHARPQRLQLAVLGMEGGWRLLVDGDGLGQFATHADALECALDIARETRGEGCSVEVLDHDRFGEVTRVPDDHDA